MPLVINASGYIEVWRDGALVSRHNVESNAIEAIVAHAEANGDGDYELRYPNKIVMSRLRKQVVPFTWNPINLAFVNGTASSVNLAGFLANPENRSVTYSVTGSLPTGVTLSGSTVAYNGTGAVASASVRFNASWNGLTATSSASTVSINAAAPANRAPVFSVAPTSATIAYTGGTIQFTATDPDADTLTYTLPTTRTGITINSGTGLVTVASSAAGTTGSITVRATDPSGAYAEASCAVTVQSAGTGLIWAMDMSPAAAEAAGWTTTQTEAYISRTFVAGGGPSGGNAYDLTQIVGAGGDNYYGWSRRESAGNVATAGQSRFYRWKVKWIAHSGVNIVNKMLIPHDSQNGNNERAIFQPEIDATRIVFQFQHDGGANILNTTVARQLDVWFAIQWEIRYSSAPGVADGYWKVWINNTNYAAPTIQQTIVQNAPSGANYNLMRMGYVNTALSSGAHVFRIGGVEVGTAFDSGWSA